MEPLMQSRITPEHGDRDALFLILVWLALWALIFLAIGLG
jgi:hypothetical protein